MPKRKMSADARRRISEAQKKLWAARRNGTDKKQAFESLGQVNRLRVDALRAQRTYLQAEVHERQTAIDAINAELTALGVD